MPDPMTNTFVPPYSGDQGEGAQVPLGGRPDPSLVQEVKNEIRTLVSEVAQLADSAVSQSEFFDGLLGRIVSAMAAVGGVVWMVRDGGNLEAQSQVSAALVGLDGPAEARQKHGVLLRRVLTGKQAVVVPPQTPFNGDSAAVNTTDLLIVLAPLFDEGNVVGLLEIFQRPGGGPTTQRGYTRFLVQMADLANQFLKNQRMRLLADRSQLWKQLEHFLRAIHHSLDLTETSLAIVNEARRLLQCDRVSLAIREGWGYRVTAVSGLDSIDRRAGEVQQLSQLTNAVMKTGQPFWYNAGQADVPPQIDDLLQPYIDDSHCKMLAVLPLVPAPAPGASESKHPPKPTAALIVEQFQEEAIRDVLRLRADVIVQHSAQALLNAKDHSSLFLLPLWSLLGKIFSFSGPLTAFKWLVGVGAIAAIAAALIIVPADFEVAARGKLQPAQRSDVFAKVSGDVVRIPVQHGQMVQKGDLLAELKNAEMDAELAKLIGRQTVNQQQIHSLMRAQLDSSRTGPGRLTPAEENRLEGDLMQYRQEAENILRELALFGEKQKRLQVLAEESGQVITWKVEELLLRRPVERGQSLMTLANPDGPWELELYVPQRRLCHLQAAMAELRKNASGSDDAQLKVTFTLHSHSGLEFEGKIVEMEKSAEVRGEDGNTILVRVQINRDELPELHDQTTVTARIACGRRSLGYTWFCDVIETVQTKILFWL